MINPLSLQHEIILNICIYLPLPERFTLSDVLVLLAPFCFSLNISCGANLVVINFFRFCLSGKPSCISPSIVNDSFAGESILVGSFFYRAVAFWTAVSANKSSDDLKKVPCIYQALFLLLLFSFTVFRFL